MLAHMDRAADDHRVVTIQRDILRLFEVERLCLDTVAPN